MLLYRFPFGPLQTNTILIGCARSKLAAVIDPAFHSTDKILSLAKTLDLKIEKILLTHSHWDHFADASLLKEKTNAKLFIHPLDAPNLEHPGADGVPMLLPILPVKPDHFIQDKDSITVGDLRLEVLHTPGHSPGGVCYYLPKQEVLLSGDSLFQGTIGNLELSTGNPELMWPSLQKLSRLPEKTRVIPGHGEETTIGEEKWLSRAKEIFGT